MDDDLQVDSDEDLFRNPVYYEPLAATLTWTAPTSVSRKARTS
ncbi:hypothetical protein [Streptomyces sp. NBC_01092]|nr:hypothetical protein OG254_44930 [Streptomyces sp. NBC_01092]